MTLRAQAATFAVVVTVLLALWGVVALGQPGATPDPEVTTGGITVVQVPSDGTGGSACGMTPEQALAWSEARRNGPTVMLQDADPCSANH